MQIEQQRDSEYVTTNQGTKVTAVEFDEEIFAKVSHMAEAQVVQKSENELEIRVIKLDGYTQADEQVLLQRLRDVVGERMAYSVVYPESLEKGKNGKKYYKVSEYLLNGVFGYSM